MEFTRDGMVAAEMAKRNFQETIVPVIDELNTDGAKQGYIWSILCAACVELANVTGDDFNNSLDELVIMNKQAYKDTRSETPSKPS